MKNNLNVNIDKNFNWEIIQKELRNQFGNEIYESWLKKIVFEEKFTNHILVSVSLDASPSDTLKAYNKINNLINAEISNGSKDYDLEYIRNHVEKLTS